MDCSSYLVATTTVQHPITVTQAIPGTTTKTVTKWYEHAAAASCTDDVDHVRPRAAHRSIPPYAAGCKGPAMYASACSCANVHPTTVTVSPSTQTIYKHVAKTVTTTKTTKDYAAATAGGCPAAEPTFVLQAVGGTYDGQFAVETEIEGPGGIFFKPTLADASVFHITSNGRLAVPLPWNKSSTIFAESPLPRFNNYLMYFTDTDSMSFISCSLQGTEPTTLSCHSGANTVLQTGSESQGVVFLAPSLLDQNQPLVLQAHCRT